MELLEHSAPRVAAIIPPGMALFRVRGWQNFPVKLQTFSENILSFAGHMVCAVTVERGRCVFTADDA